MNMSRPPQDVKGLQKKEGEKMTNLDIIATKTKIKNLAGANGYTVTAISKTTGLHTQTVYAWFSAANKQMPTIDNLVILSDLFNCSLEDFIVCENEKE